MTLRTGIHYPHGDALSSLSLGGACCCEGVINLSDLSDPVEIGHVTVPKNSASAVLIEVALSMTDGSTRLMIFGSVGFAATRGTGDVETEDGAPFYIDPWIWRDPIAGESFNLVPTASGDRVAFAISYVRPGYTPTSARLTYIIRELAGCVVTGR
jgi:hypothetical protein